MHPATGDTTPIRIVLLSASRTLALGIDALPRVKPAAAIPGAGRVNAQLSAIDVAFLKDPDVIFCRTPWDGPSGVDRAVTITLRGARYLSMMLQTTCYRGAHPATEIESLTFDLRTGARLQAADLLPRSLRSANSAALSRGLSRLYMESVHGGDARTCTTGNGDGDKGNTFLADQHTFTVWADAKGDGIALDPNDFPFVDATCGIPMVVPIARMRALGVTPALLDDIARAHAHRWY